MSDDNEKKDLTRIEDLSEFLHDDNEDFSDLDTYSDGEEEEEDSGFMDQATDPDIEFPAEFKPDQEDDSQDDNSSDDFNTNFEEGEESVSFGSDDSSDFGSDDSSDFGSDDSSEFGSDDSSDFGSDDSSDFGSDDSSDFGSDESSDFGSDDSSDFGSDESSDFGSDDSSDFGSDESSGFGSDDSSDFGSDDSSNFTYEGQDDYQEDDQSNFESDDNIIETSLDENQSDSISEVIEDTITNQPKKENPSDDLNLPTDNSTSKVENAPPNENNNSPTEKTPIPQYADKEEFKSPENFNELQKFAKNISYGNMGHEGNPPFSIILKNIKFKEDIDDIVAILQEFNIVDEEGAKIASESLHRGTMLIPRLGEYSAIHLCHKLRRFDISILMGLTEEIHPPKSYESDDSGIVSKYTVYNTRSHQYIYDHDEVKLEDIITSTTPVLEGYHIREYITVTSEYIILDAKSIANANNLEGELKSAIPDYQRERVDKTEVRSANIQASNSQVIKDFFPTNNDETTNNENNSNLNDIYSSLLDKLKLSALEKKGNAIVGVSYNVTPIIQDQVYYTETQYQVTCSGSVVWAMKV